MGVLRHMRLPNPHEKGALVEAVAGPAFPTKRGGRRSPSPSRRQRSSTGMTVVSLISSITKEAETSESGTLAIRR